MHIVNCEFFPDPSLDAHSITFVTKQSPWSFITRYLNTWKSPASVILYLTCPVAFWSLSALEHLQGLHHQRHIRCLSGVWSGTTLHGTSVQLSQPFDTTQHDLWDNAAAVADFINLDNWWYEMSCWAITTTATPSSHSPTTYMLCNSHITLSHFSCYTSSHQGFSLKQL